MLDENQIRSTGIQPAAIVTDSHLERLIERDFGSAANEVTKKLADIIDNIASHNRISEAILKLSNKNIDKVDHYIKLAKVDTRDVISQAEYPRCSELDFDEMEEQDMTQIYVDDWVEYFKWFNQ